jgi:hypothetical protein
MGTCFVIQPFDHGPFDERYEDILDPAIRSCGLEPYRVDKDPHVSIPIDSIQAGILNAEMCIADITEDNPNVWFELGFAIASNKEILLICSKERKTTFPFDVQHRTIITYSTSAPRDFQELQEKISLRIKAISEKRNKIGMISAAPILETEGLSQYEMVALVSIAQNTLNPEEATYTHAIR